MPAAVREQPVAVVILYPPAGTLRSDDGSRSAGNKLVSAVGSAPDLRSEAAVLVQIKVGTSLLYTGKMLYADLDAVFKRRCKSDRQHRSAESLSPAVYPLADRADSHRASVSLNVIYLRRVFNVKTRPVKPVSVRDLHNSTP